VDNTEFCEISLCELAKITEETEYQWRNIFQGRRDLKESTIRKFANKLGMTNAEFYVALENRRDAELARERERILLRLDEIDNKLNIVKKRRQVGKKSNLPTSDIRLVSSA
jgi:plasmid maintenance system antidote protein VapI